MRMLRRGLIATVLVAGLAVATATPTAATPHPGHGVKVRSFDQQLLKKVNHARKAHHLAAYTFSPTLWKIAHSWAKHLAADGALSHRANLTTVVQQKCSKHSKAGENVAFVSGGTGQLKALYHQYVADKAHRANVFSDTFTHIGIASIKKTVGGQVQEWSVMDLATRC
ncbi:MAG: CAP domain-containing protein [Frankiaceae bacterium]|nr:CAP domain-containing protein [Frankiaceae bacterium]MBV9871268.1 CAP domain-containing protein [Frankiaceae bacterium]